MVGDGDDGDDDQGDDGDVYYCDDEYGDDDDDDSDDDGDDDDDSDGNATERIKKLLRNLSTIHNVFAASGHLCKREACSDQTLASSILPPTAG